MGILAIVIMLVCIFRELQDIHFDLKHIREELEIIDYDLRNADMRDEK